MTLFLKIYIVYLLNDVLSGLDAGALLPGPHGAGDEAGDCALPRPHPVLCQEVSAWTTGSTASQLGMVRISNWQDTGYTAKYSATYRPITDRLSKYKSCKWVGDIIIIFAFTALCL